MMKRAIKISILLASVCVVGTMCLGGWIYYGYKNTNPYNVKTIGEIPTPMGFSRVDGEDEQFAQFLRSLPLKSRGSRIQLYTGGDSRLQWLGYAVLDLPILNNAEQCADCCMRLRAEYLYEEGKYSSIRFMDVNGNIVKYTGGGNRGRFETYLKNLYGIASTYSLKREMKPRTLSDMQPGDVFVYAAGDHDHERKIKSKMGHAMMVADVAVDSKGRKAFLLVEGNTPAREMHVVRNMGNPLRSPWYILDEEANVLLLPFYYKSDELKHF